MFSHFPSAADFIFVASQSFGNIASTSYRMDNASGVHFVLPFGLASFGFGRGRKSQAHFALSLSHDFHVGEKLYGFFLRQSFHQRHRRHPRKSCAIFGFNALWTVLPIQLFYSQNFEFGNLAFLYNMRFLYSTIWAALILCRFSL